ncbi:MAG: hypothetical protein V4550_00535 [Gemmatimonadota bacterium]
MIPATTRTPFLRQSPAERAAELLANERETERMARRLLIQTLLGCAICSALGILLVSWAVHTTDAGWAEIAFWGGLLVGDGGMMFLLLRHYRRQEQLGE